MAFYQLDQQRPDRYLSLKLPPGIEQLRLYEVFGAGGDNIAKHVKMPISGVLIFLSIVLPLLNGMP